uniref:Uncharacterized protein n=1 Tax=Meloidogyne enterolobii TaxID=390850 RepID=A0A6V7TWG6_MELEN|nr:unnamed protein product [Meloidogyne enterolobii]
MGTPMYNHPDLQKLKLVHISALSALLVDILIRMKKFQMLFLLGRSLMASRMQSLLQSNHNKKSRKESRRRTANSQIGKTRERSQIWIQTLSTLATDLLIRRSERTFRKMIRVLLTLNNQKRQKFISKKFPIPMTFRNRLLNVLARNFWSN